MNNFKDIFNNCNENNYSKAIVIEREDKEFLNESVNKIEHIEDSIKNDVNNYNNINKEYLILDDYVIFIKEENEKNTLSNIDVQVWYKFNKYD